jgi:late competence protein required for DNA uptake (superfamily II DNA/RNA helicase)
MIDVRLSENKIIECSRCGNPMLLTKAKMDLAKPHCDDCTRSTKPKDEIVGALEDLFKEKDANDNNE